jgi:HK97 family phage portal protein
VLDWFVKDSRQTSLITWNRHAQRGEANEQLINAGFKLNAVASACIKLKAKAATNGAILRVYKRMRNGEKREITNHWLLKVLQRPNPFLSAYELWELTHIFSDTSGNCFWELVRRANHPSAEVVEIYPMRPDRVEIIPDSKNLIAGYVYKVAGREVRFEPWEVLHFKRPNPLNDFWGASPLEPIARELGIDNEANDFTETFFKNNGVPYGLLIKEDKRVTEAEAKRTRLRFFNWFKGKMRFVPPVIGNGLKFMPLSLDFQKMDVKTLRSISEARICGAFGVDPVLVSAYVGIELGGKYSNYQEARRHLWEETLIPELRRLESKITSQLLVTEGLFCEFDLSGVEALQENANDNATRAVSLFQAGIYTLNEAREEMQKNKDDQLGDLYKWQIDRLQTVEVLDNQPEPVEEDETENKSFTLKSADISGYLEDMRRAQEQLEPVYTGQLQKVFSEHEKDVLDVLNKKDLSAEELAVLLAAIKALIPRWGKRVERIVRALITAGVEVSGTITSNLMGNEEFKPTNSEIEKYLDEYLPKFIRQYENVTLEEIAGVLRRAHDEGLSIPEVRDLIKEKFKQFSDNRALTIARSEIIRSSNAAAKMTYQKAGIKRLVWHTHADERRCPFCKKFHMKEINIDESFAELGDTITAEDETGQMVSYTVDFAPVEFPPLHPNCRCALIPKL